MPSDLEIKTFFSRYKDPIGIEVEVEGVQSLKLSSHFYTYWREDEDGSLKDRGKEFISIPLSGKHIDYALHYLDELCSDTRLKWTHRTSIHVHANVSRYSEEDLAALILLYALFEELLFAFVDPVRSNNPYCYKITSVAPEECFNAGMTTKYCALNISPVKTFCTVEFRHLQGVGNTKTIRRWVQLVVKLRQFVTDNGSAAVFSLIDTALLQQDVTGLFKRVFGASTVLFSDLDINKLCLKHDLWIATARSAACVEL
jgi:hypothetical protein